MIMIMLDLETWGKRPGCDIRSIRACVFDPETGRVGAEPAPGGCNTFYIACDNPVIATRPGMEGDTPIYKYPLTRDPDTVQWWSEQSDEAQAAFASPVNLGAALTLFGDWLQGLNGNFYFVARADERYEDDLRIWAHGPQFDISILEAAYHAVGLPVPWHYRAPRDTRTILEAAGIDPHKGLEMFVQPGDVYHHALSDAVVQARAVCAAYKVLRSKPARYNINPDDPNDPVFDTLFVDDQADAFQPNRGPLPHMRAPYRVVADATYRKLIAHINGAPARQSSPALSSLAAHVLHLGATGTPEYNALLLTAKRLAGSVLSQDETP